MTKTVNQQCVNETFNMNKLKESKYPAFRYIFKGIDCKIHFRFKIKLIGVHLCSATLIPPNFIR